MAQNNVKTSQIHKGIVKQIISGDCLVIRGQPRGGPPPERTLVLSYIVAPKLARRGSEGSGDTKDEPFAWQAREFLRKLLIGKEVQFTIEHTTQTGREYGIVWMNRGGERISVSELIVMEGLVEVRQANVRPSEELTKLIQIENEAKVQEKGKWTKTSANNSVRNVVWSVDNLRQFVDKNNGKQKNAIVEHVRDGCTIRVILLPTYEILTVAMTGIKCPVFKKEQGKDIVEPFAEQAKFFTESRLLQRDIKLLIEGLNTQNIILATVIHPAGNIAELLLKEGFGWCVDWSMALVTNDKEKLRAAEKHAKSNNLRHWKDYQSKQVVTSCSPSLPSSGKVVEVINSDALVIKSDKGQFHKIFFSSVRPPRKQQEDGSDQSASNATLKVRPLYDVPYMFEAREFLRKKLIGKRVNVTVDYIKPAQDQFPERIYCTVTTREGMNVAEALINKGLVTCLKHSHNDDQRSSCYDDLLSAENKAIKNKKGLHSKKESTMHRVADVSGDSSKAKQFLPFLQRAGRTVALVEFVASGSRMKLYLPKDTCLVNFILAGVNCPRAGGGNERQKIAAEPFGQDALLYTKELVMQREVEVEVENCDKGGNMIGWMFIDGNNLAILLVEEGYCKILPQAERSPYYQQLFKAEEEARSARKKIWENYVETKDDTSNEDEDDDTNAENKIPNESDNSVQSTASQERKIDYKKVIVTEVVSGNHFWAQNVDQGPQFEALMEQMRNELTSSPPLTGSYTPRKGSKCAALFTDGLWYRACIEKVVSQTEVQVLYIDYGNHLVIPSTNLAALPSSYITAPLAKEYYLACIQLPSDDEWLYEAKVFLQQQVLDKTLLSNLEYKIQGMDYVTLTGQEADADIGEKMIAEGLVSVIRRKDKRLHSLVSKYIESEESARKNHVNIWRYGDFTADDAKEFGYTSINQ